jgi:RNA polymerase sigma-70 factor (ECF subfamily)
VLGWGVCLARRAPYTWHAMEPNADQLSELMQRYARAEDVVFEQLYRLMAPRLYRFCLRLATRQSEADDVFQGTLLRIHRARVTYLAGSNMLHWAFAISRSVYLDRLRYRRRRPEDLGSANDAADQEQPHADDRYSPEAALRARDVQAVLTRELSRMSEKNRVAYVLLKEEGLSVKEAAAVLGATAAVVRQRAHRAYIQLRTALSAAGWQEYDDDESWDAVPVQV